MGMYKAEPLKDDGVMDLVLAGALIISLQAANARKAVNTLEGCGRDIGRNSHCTINNPIDRSSTKHHMFRRVNIFLCPSLYRL